MEIVEKVDSEFRVRTYIGKGAKVLTAIAVIWSVFQIFAAGSGIFDAITLRAWHMMFLLVVTFL